METSPAPGPFELIVIAVVCLILIARYGTNERNE